MYWYLAEFIAQQRFYITRYFAIKWLIYIDKKFNFLHNVIF